MNGEQKSTRKVNLKMKMVLLIGVLVIGVLLVIGVFSHYFITNLSKGQMGERALAVSKSVARIPEIGTAFEAENPAEKIQAIVAPIQKATGAEFIVVGNLDEIRYAHPIEEAIGKRMVGEDNEAALIYGESYISEATGSLGTSLRAKSPIIVDGQIVGVVSVGFLANDIRSITQGFTKEIWLILSMIAIVAIIGAVIIANYIKRLLFNLEPEEIASLYDQREKILQSTHEGILAVDEKGEITMMNAAAEKILGKQEHSFIGQPIEMIIPTLQIMPVLQNGKSLSDEEFVIDGHFIYINVLPIQVEQFIVGAVATIRNKTEIELLSKELAYVKQYSNALRAQTHEFSNKLHTMLGLLLLNRQEEAIMFIKQESEVQLDAIRNLIDDIADPFISGLLIGKFSVAEELKIKIIIHPNSLLQTQLSEKKRDVLLTAVGNIIDNAIDELSDNEKRQIAIYFTDIGDEVVFEIEDSGNGITPEVMPHLFTQGFSTKNGDSRGYGLANVKRLLDDVNGTLYLEEGELAGACFIISIPKEEKRG